MSINSIVFTFIIIFGITNSFCGDWDVLNPIDVGQQAAYDDLVAKIILANGTVGPHTINLPEKSEFVFPITTLRNKNGYTALPFIDQEIIVNANNSKFSIPNSYTIETLRFFFVEYGAKLEINNLTLDGGSAINGGAIYNAGSLILRNTTINNTNKKFLNELRQKRYGTSTTEIGNDGAIFNNSRYFPGEDNNIMASLKIYNCHFVGNLAQWGGAITNLYGKVDIYNSEFLRNTGLGHGGAISNGRNYTAYGYEIHNRVVNIYNTRFIENVAGDQDDIVVNLDGGGTNVVHRMAPGGAIDNQTVMNIQNSFFYKNVALEGGAIRNAGLLNIDNSTFAQNRVYRSAVFSDMSDDVDFNSLITARGLPSDPIVAVSQPLLPYVAPNFPFGSDIPGTKLLDPVNGGVLSNKYIFAPVRALITNSTLAYNVSEVWGGGVFAEATLGSVSIHNVILSNNATYHPDNTTSSPNCKGYLHMWLGSDDRNVIPDLTGCAVINGSSNIIGSDPNLLELDFSTGVYPIDMTSSAINMGRFTQISEYDQRGLNRHYGFLDIGAYEYHPDAVTMCEELEDGYQVSVDKLADDHLRYSVLSNKSLSQARATVYIDRNGTIIPLFGYPDSPNPVSLCDTKVNGVQQYCFEHTGYDYQNLDEIIVQFEVDDGVNTAYPDIYTYIYEGDQANEFIEVKDDGNVHYSLTLNQQVSTINFWSKINGTEFDLGNVKSSEQDNLDGTFTYLFDHSKYHYSKGDILEARVEYTLPPSDNYFLPGPDNTVYSSEIQYEWGMVPEISHEILSLGEVKITVTFSESKDAIKALIKRVSNVFPEVSIDLSTEVHDPTNNTWSYSALFPAYYFNTGDILEPRIWSSVSIRGEEFVPGADASVWGDEFEYDYVFNCTAVLPDGNYYMKNTNSNKCVEVENNGTENGANIRQWGCNQTSGQRWEATHLGDCIYELRGENSGKLLEKSNYGNDVNVHQWWSDPSNSYQQWRLTESGVGSYTLRSMKNEDKCLDVASAGVNDGANIQAYDCNDTDAQKFQFEEYVSGSLSGAYKIMNELSGKCLDVQDGSYADGSNIHQWDCYDTNLQRWEIIHVSGDVYGFRNVQTGKLLDIEWGGGGSNIQQWYSSSVGGSQQWKLELQGNGSYIFKSIIRSGECMEISWASTWAGANVQSYNCLWNGAQRFWLYR